jgi:hypothetical protein
MKPFPALILIVAAAIGAQADTSFEDKVQKSVPARPGGTLTIEAEWGSIEVIPGDSARVDVEVQRKVEAGDRAAADAIFRDFDLQVTPAATGVTVRGIFKTGWKPESSFSWIHGRRICRNNRCLEYADRLRTHHYRVTVPREFNVDAQTDGGSIAVGDLKGTMKSRTSGGSLKFGSIQGSITGKTSGGSITVGAATGPVDVHTSGGSLHLGEVGGKLTAHTSGGSINIKGSAGEIDASTSGGSVSAVLTAQPKGLCRLSTSGGSVTVELGASVGVNLDASTSGGRVVVDFPVAASGERHRREIRGPVNGGGPELRLRTSGGNIYVRRRSSAG